MPSKKALPLRLGEALKEAAGGLGIKDCLNEAKVALCWGRVAGERVAKNASPYVVRRGLLFIETKSAAWAQEIGFVKKELIKKMNQELKEPLIKDIRFKTKGYKEEKPLAKGKKLPSLAKVSLTKEEREEIKKMTERVTSKDVRRELERVLALDKRLKKQRAEAP